MSDRREAMKRGDFSNYQAVKLLSGRGLLHLAPIQFDANLITLCGKLAGDESKEKFTASQCLKCYRKAKKERA